MFNLVENQFSPSGSLPCRQDKKLHVEVLKIFSAHFCCILYLQKLNRRYTLVCYNNVQGNLIKHARVKAISNEL